MAHEPQSGLEHRLGESESTPPLRRFEAVSAKGKATDSFTARFLDNDGNLVGSNVTIYDSENQFHTEAADYVGTIQGFRGVALLRTDLATEEPDAPRWEVVVMEGFAQWVIVKYNSSEEEWQLEANAFGGDSWDFKRPVANGAELTVTDPLSGYPSPIGDELAYAELVNPDTSPPTYAIRNARKTEGGGSVRWGEVYTEITAATGWAAADRGTGEVQFFDSDGDPDGSPETVRSWYRDAFPVGAVVGIQGGLVVSVGCTLAEEE